MEPRIARPEDADEVAAILTAAFVADPVMEWVFTDPGRAEKLGVVFQFLAAEADIPLGATWLGDGAVASWTPPGTPDWPHERVTRFVTALAEVADDAELTRFAQLDEASVAARPVEPHWYLGFIGTRPERTGQGLGGALLQASLAQVDADGLAAYLESSNPRNVTLYQRHGFEPIGEITLVDGPPQTSMLRPPRRSVARSA